MKDIMIDIETLGTRSTSAIAQIGAVYFDRETGELGEEFCMNIKSDRSTNFTTDEATAVWWLDQPAEVRDSVFLNGEHIDYVVGHLAEFLGASGCLWSHATFDIPIIMHAFEVCRVEFPLHYTKMRDIRTLMDITNSKKSDLVREGLHHNALDDAKFQVKYCVAALNKLST